MTYVVTPPPLQPPLRYDNVPWESVEVWESDDGTLTGTYALIETQTIPVEATPASPSEVLITLTQAEFPVTWLQSRFVDEDGNYSAFSDPFLAPADAMGTDFLPVAEYAKMHMGGENWAILTTAESYGEAYVMLAIATVKQRVMAVPVTTAEEPGLDPRLLNYLGILSAIALLPAARDAWASRTITNSIGNDPREISTYTDRAKGIDELLKQLLRQLPAIEAAVIPILDQPLVGAGSRPAIDELDDFKVMDDPRLFPPAFYFPYPRYIYDGRSYP